MELEKCTVELYGLACLCLVGKEMPSGICRSEGRLGVIVQMQDLVSEKDAFNVKVALRNNSS